MPTIIYEDENILAINKPAGLLVHATENSKSPTLADWIQKERPEIEGVGEDSLRPGIVHRLDKETSGVLLVAKNQKSFEFLKKQFQNREIKKTYLALVSVRGGSALGGKGKINTPIKRFTKIRDAETEYTIIKRYKDYTLLGVSPKTGRTHQIRIHLKSIGHPVVCDKLYTKKPDCPFGLKRHFLHASSIELTLPDGKRMRIDADMPEDLSLVLKSLR